MIFTLVQSKIQPIQLFVLIVLFEIGSTVVVGLGLEAKQDAWLVIFLAFLLGCHCHDEKENPEEKTKKISNLKNLNDSASEAD